jgi:CubicO group peptidase (beta-lactamase class C family)
MEIPEFTNLDQVHRYLDDLAQSGKFGGVVLVERPDQKPWFHAYGLANKETGVPNSAKTRFNVGSITKAFTSVAVMQLVEAGKIALDDPMGKHLTGFPPEIASKVTVRHLLKMESGYGDYFGSPIYQANRTRLRTIDDLLEILRTLDLGFEPGTDNQYSNAGYAILGAIVEKVSGMSYCDYVEKHVFRAAGMKGSSFPDYASHDKHVAMGYTNDGDSGRRDFSEPYLDFFAPKGSPAGGSFSTAEDLVTFNRALRANRLLNDGNTTLLLNFFNEDRPRPSRRAIAGGAPGVSAINYEDASLGITVIVLSNQDEPLGERVGETIFEMLAGS